MLQPQEYLPSSGLESFSSPFITSENYSRLASCHYTELLKGNQSLDNAGGIRLIGAEIKLDITKGEIDAVYIS